MRKRNENYRNPLGNMTYKDVWDLKKLPEDKLEEFHKKYNDAESDEEKMKIAIECGKFLASEILENTDDRTGLIDTIE